MKEKSNFSFKNRIYSFRFAVNGLKLLIQNEHNSRIHLTLLIAVLLCGILFEIGLYEWIAISIVSGLVFIIELINSAVEKLADYVEPEIKKEIGIIKDYCAAAVLVSAIISITVGAIIFIPKVLTFANIS